MPDKFTKLEERGSRTQILVVLAIVILGAIAVYRWATSDFQPLHGRVEAVGADTVSASGRAVATVSVRLPDGSRVDAEVVSGGPLAVGDRVRLVVGPDSASGTPYEVVAKLPATAP